MARVESLRSVYFLAAAAIAAGSAADAAAAGAEHVAYLGLVPPGVRSAEPADVLERSQPGLKKPRDVSARLGMMVDWASMNEGGPVLYSGSRPAPAGGLAASQFVTGLHFSLAPGWTSTIETSVDSPASFAGRGYALGGQLHRLLPGGFGVSLGLRHNVYDFGASRLLAGGEGLGAFTAPALAAHPALRSSFSATGYELRLNYRYGERNILGLTYGAGGDFDQTRHMLGLYPNEGRQFGLTGEHWLTTDWSLSYGLMAHEQSGPHRGQGLRLGLRYRF